MPTYKNVKYLTLPQQVQANKIALKNLPVLQANITVEEIEAIADQIIISASAEYKSLVEAQIDAEILTVQTEVDAFVALAETSINNAITEAQAHIDTIYTYKGSVLFANLPTTGQTIGDVYNVMDGFTLDGETYLAGVDVAWNGTDWDAIKRTYDDAENINYDPSDSKLTETNVKTAIDKLSHLGTLKKLSIDDIPYTDWTEETMSSPGVIIASTTRILSGYIKVAKNTILMCNEYTKKIYIHYLDEDENYLGNSGGWINFIKFEEEKIIRIVAANSDNSAYSTTAEVYEGLKFLFDTDQEMINPTHEKKNIKVWMRNGLNSSGVLVGTDIRISTYFFWAEKGQSIFSTSDNILFVVHYFDESKVWESSDNTYNYRHDILKDGYIKLVAKYSDDSAIVYADEMQQYIYITNKFLTNHLKYIDESRRPIYNLAGVLLAGQSIAFVGDELWAFGGNTSDDDTTFDTVIRFSIDYDAQTLTQLGTFTHNWGHCNTLEYNEVTDTIILGSGTGVLATAGDGDYSTKGIFIFPNASTFGAETSIPIGTYGIIIDLSAEGWGRQFNVIWGEDNDGKNNICYVLTNDGTTTSDTSTIWSKYMIHRVLLGQGTNNLGSGTFLAGKTGLQFNGTYKELNEWVMEYAHNEHECVQDAVFYKGKIITGLGHDGIWINEITLNEDGTFTSIKKREKYWFNDDGSVITLISQALTIKDDLLYIKVYDSVRETSEIRVYKI